MKFVSRNIYPQPEDDPEHISLDYILSSCRILISFVPPISKFMSAFLIMCVYICLYLYILQILI